MDHVVYIGIGSNLGDRWNNCVLAVEMLRRDGNFELIAVSKWRETEALTLEGDEGPKYVNGAVKVKTTLKPQDLLGALKNIESAMGRNPVHEKWSPRSVDLDILFYDDLVLNDGGLTIPHPETHKRMFVLEPLCDIDAGLLHPVLKTTVSELCRRLT